jgi:hypothetical protein
MKVPRELSGRVDAVVQITDEVCGRHLTPEYASLARGLAAALARKRPSPLLKGTPHTWACGVVYALGKVNFLFDPSQKPHFRAGDLCALFGVSQSNASAKARDIMRMLKMVPLDPAWCLPSQLKDNPLAWMVSINGFLVDARTLPRDLQEQAWRAGAIPFVPEPGGVEAADASGPASSPQSAPGKDT